MTKIYASSDKNVSKREKDHMELARSAAGECMVLLDNDGVLPIRHKGYIALYGNGARNTIKGGTGSGEVNSRMSVNIEQGLINAGYTVTTGNWLDRQDEHYKKSKKEYLKWVPEYARKQNITEFLVSFSHPFQVPFPCDITDRDIQASDTDTAVYVIARTSGEGADRYNKRGDYLLYEEEKEQLLLLAKTYKNLILVLNIGGVIDLSEVKDIEGINAVLLMTQLGNVGGDALADVISGKVNPSGKLSDTWAKSYADYPSSEGFSHNDSTVDDEYYTEGIYVGNQSYCRKRNC